MVVLETVSPVATGVIVDLTTQPLVLKWLQDYGTYVQPAEGFSARVSAVMLACARTWWIYTAKGVEVH